jgi:multidrug resistance efflux pump
MPSPLRARLRRFAEERNLGEAEALRLALSEHLNEIESASDLAGAERWQFEQAYATWQRYRQGVEQLVPREEIDRTFERALARRPPTSRRRK